MCVDKEKLKSIIKEQMEGLKQKFENENIISRDSDANDYLSSNVALFILGVRRCGKSTLAAQLFFGRPFGYINLDDERLIGLTANDLNTILQAFYEMFGGDLRNIILDEIQGINGWEMFVSRLRETKRVIVTGSNSKLLSGELATYMTGRHIDVSVYPFSFAEYLRYRGVRLGAVLTTTERARANSLIIEYLQNGGFPEFFKYGKAALDGIYNDIITKDIIQRHGIKHTDALRQIARYLVSNSSQEFTYSSLKNITTVKNQITITNWVKYIEESYLIFDIERFSFKLKNIAIAPKKGYAIDTGIVNLLGFRSDENRARLMETAVAIELKRRCAADRNNEVYYWKDHQQHEVDFVVKKNNKIEQLIQVTYASARDEINRRETENLIKASAELHCNSLFIVTLDYEAKEKIGRKPITFVPLWKWLLEK
jgi:hypothetical protein